MKRKNILNQRRIKMAHFNSSGSDTSNDLKRAPRRGAVLNLHWYKIQKAENPYELEDIILWGIILFYCIDIVFWYHI
jgi:hypothetical protein